jgi:hypothetical protein
VRVRREERKSRLGSRSDTAGANQAGSSAEDINWTKHLITADQKDATNIVIHDMNGDGRPDFVASCGHGIGIVWYEPPSWTPHEIVPDLKGPHALAVDDVNGDGRPDVVPVAKNERSPPGMKTTARADSSSSLR